MAGTDRLNRAAAVMALGSALAALAVMCAAVREHPWSMLGIVVALPAAVVAGWHVVSRRGVSRVVAGLVVLAAVAGPVLHVLAHRPVSLLLTGLLLGFSMASARRALLPVTRRPRRVHHRSGVRVAAAGRAVLLVNPRAGGDRAAGLGLAEFARPLGVDGVAGGDGSMAPVAAVAARCGLPFVCVPAGTRNHFALDLGLDRTDLAHAMTAFEPTVQYRVDLAEVNGRVFVNNVSLGVYAAVVSSRNYRRSKLRAVLDELPNVIGPESEPAPLRFQAPEDTAHSGTHALLVSNNPYRLGGLGQAAEAVGVVRHQ